MANPNLQWLDVSRTPRYKHREFQITDDTVIAVVDHCKQLELLDVSNCNAVGRATGREHTHTLSFSFPSHPPRMHAAHGSVAGIPCRERHNFEIIITQESTSNHGREYHGPWRLATALPSSHLVADLYK